MGKEGRLLKDLLLYLPGQVTAALVGLISIPVLTRLFFPRDYGYYCLALATVLAFSSLLGWVPAAIVRYQPIYAKGGHSGEFYLNILVLGCGSTLSLLGGYLLLLFALRGSLEPQLLELLQIGAGVFAVSGLADVLHHLLRSQGKAGWYSGITAWRSVAGFLGGVGLVLLTGGSISGMLWGAIVATLAVGPLLWLVALRGFVPRRSELQWDLMRRMVRFSLPLLAGHLAAWVISSSDRFVLQIFRGSREVGIYSAAYNLSEKSILFFIVLFMLAFSPEAARVWEHEGPERSRAFTRLATRYFLMITVPIAVLISVLSRPLLLVLTGAPYLEGHRVIPFVAAGMVCFGVQYAFQAGFFYHQKTLFITGAVACCALANLLLDLAFVPRFGYLAAAITTLACYVLLTLILVVGSLRIFAWRFPLASLLRFLLAGSAMGVAAHLVMAHLSAPEALRLAAAAGCGALVYGGSLVLLREISPARVRELGALVGRRRP